MRMSIISSVLSSVAVALGVSPKEEARPFPEWNAKKDQQIARLCMHGQEMERDFRRWASEQGLSQDDQIRFLLTNMSYEPNLIARGTSWLEQDND